MAKFTMLNAAGRAIGCGLLLAALAGCAQNPQPGAENGTPSATPPATPSATASAPAVPDRQPHTLVLEATGGGNVTNVKYTLDGQDVQRGPVTLPWRESITIPNDGQPHSYSLEVEFKGGGKVDLVAIFNGQVVARGGSAGSGNSTGNAAVGGTVQG
jgi:hypothetical protein